MQKTTQIISWILYFLSLIFLLIGLIFRHEHIIVYLGYTTFILTIPWIICIVNSFKSKNSSNGLWPFFLFFFGLIAIPLYLIKIQKPNKIRYGT
jgi:hypothetical protein